MIKIKSGQIYTPKQDMKDRPKQFLYLRVDSQYESSERYQCSLSNDGVKWQFWSAPLSKSFICGNYDLTEMSPVEQKNENILSRVIE